MRKLIDKKECIPVRIWNSSGLSQFICLIILIDDFLHRLIFLKICISKLEYFSGFSLQLLRANDSFEAPIKAVKLRFYKIATKNKDYLKIFGYRYVRIILSIIRTFSKSIGTSRMYFIIIIIAYFLIRYSDAFLIKLISVFLADIRENGSYLSHRKWYNEQF